MNGEKHIIRVGPEITPIDYAIRTAPVLQVGEDYYVCFGNNIVYPCRLNKIIDGTPKKLVISKYDNGKLFGEHVLFSNEIGQTPEEAVRNSVLF